MKKNFRIFLSMLLVLLSTVQCAGGLVFADDAKVTGKESLVFEIYVPNPDQDSEEKLIRVAAEQEAELLNAKPYSLVVGKDDGEKKATSLTRMPAELTLEDLLKEDLVITPPEGFVVSQAYLRGDELKEGQTKKALPLTAEKNSAVLTLKAGALASRDESEDHPLFEEDLFSSFSTADPQVYTLVLVFSPVDAEKALTITEFLDTNSAGTETQIQPGESYVVADAPQDPETRHFSHWQLRYENGASLNLQPGESFVPFADCQVVAQWTEIITVIANSPVQSGEVFVSNGYSYRGSLAAGDQLDSVDLFVSEQDGQYICTPSSAVIKNGDKDVTGHYVLRYLASDPVEKQAEEPTEDPTDPEPTDPPVEPDTGDTPEKPVEKIQLVIAAKAPVLDEDGKNFVHNGYELTGTLAEGDALESLVIRVEETEDGKFIAVPSSAVIKNSETETTENYEIEYKQSEAVERPAPEKIAITVRSKDRSAEYTGNLITAEEYEITEGALAEGDTIEVSYNGGSTDVTASPVAGTIASVVIKDRDGTDVTESKYAVTIDNEHAGKITVTRHTITITAITGSVTTNGNKVIKASDCATADKSFQHGYKAEGLLSGHELRGSFVLGSGKETFVTSIDKNAVQIVDTKNGDADVTANYDIKTVDGKLTINVNAKTDVPVAVTLKDQSWSYDGTAHSADQTAYSISGLLDGDVATVTLQIRQGDQNLDSVTNSGTYSIVPVVTIRDKNGAAVSADKYKINAGTATLTVQKYDLKLEAVSASKAYDGKALVNNNVKATSLVSGHKFREKDGVKFTVTDAKGNLVTNGVINVGTYTKKVTEVHIVDANGNDVTENYNITKIDGKLTITQGVTSQNDSTMPKTGDESKTLFVILLVASALLLAAIVAFVILQNKKKKAFDPEPDLEAAEVEEPETEEADIVPESLLESLHEADQNDRN